MFIDIFNENVYFTVLLIDYLININVRKRDVHIYNRSMDGWFFFLVKMSSYPVIKLNFKIKEWKILFIYFKLLSTSN